MFSVESTCNHLKIAFPGERYNTKKLQPKAHSHTPTGTKDNSTHTLKSQY